MAAPFVIDNKLGYDLNNTVLATDLASGAARPVTNLGVLVQGSDGRTYVYAQANATIAANTAVCTVNATTFLATATGGAYRTTTAMVTGDQGWFSKVGV